MDVDRRQLSLDRRQVLAAGVAALTIPGWIAACGRPDEAGAAWNDDPRAFTERFRCNHVAVPARATTPAEEAAQFEAWSRGAR